MSEYKVGSISDLIFKSATSNKNFTPQKKNVKLGSKNEGSTKNKKAFKNKSSSVENGSDSVNDSEHDDSVDNIEIKSVENMPVVSEEKIKNKKAKRKQKNKMKQAEKAQKTEGETNVEMQEVVEEPKVKKSKKKSKKINQGETEEKRQEDSSVDEEVNNASNQEEIVEPKSKKAKKRSKDIDDNTEKIVKKKKKKEHKEGNDEDIEEGTPKADDAPNDLEVNTTENKDNDDLDDLDLVGERTIFIGNWPLNKLKKHLKAIFKKYGTIESVRFRSVPLKDPRISKRVSAITKQFHPDRTSTNAYVKFADVDSANKALAENGSLYFDHHLRVTLSNNCKLTQGHSIFIGNLSFNTEDEQLWRVFSVCGEIENVRILRDANTGMSRGCAYVNFKSNDGVELAMQMPETTINNRVIRIKRPETKVNKSKVKSENFVNKFNKQIAKNIPKTKKPMGKKEGFQGFRGTKKNKKNFKKTKRSRPSFQPKSRNFNKKESVST